MCDVNAEGVHFLVCEKNQCDDVAVVVVEERKKRY